VPTYIGNCACYLHKKSDYEPLRMYSAIYATPSPPEVNERSTMSGRTTPLSRELDSNWDQDLSTGTTRRIGTEYGTPRSTVDLTRSPRTFESVLTRNYEGLPTTTLPRNLLSELLNVTGDRLVPESHEEPGMRPGGMHTPRYRHPNFGMDTTGMTTSLSMNLPGRSRLNTYYDGSTGTPSMSRRRVQPQFLGHLASGSPPISTPENGTQWRQMNSAGR